MSNMVVRNGDQVIIVSLGGAPGPKGDPSGPLGAGSVGATELVNGAIDLAAVRTKLGITGQVVSLTGNTTIAEFNPRPGDSYALNGFTLTIARMADTPLAGLFTGTGIVVIQSGLSRPRWFALQPLRSAARAVSMGGGGRIALDPIVYAPEFTIAAPMNWPHVTFAGAGKPKFAAGFSTLSGGTVLRGPFVIDAANVAVEDCGVDSGSVVCAALYGGVAQEGLIAPNIGQNPAKELRLGIRFSRVTVLCKDADAAAHCILVESAIGAIVEDFDLVYASNGIAMKTQKSIVRNGYCRGHRTNFAIDKSDSYANSFDNRWSDILGESLTGTDTGPFRIQAATASSGGHTLTRIRAKGTTVGVSLEPSGPYVIADLTLEAITGDGIQFIGITMGGAIYRTSISNTRFNNILESAGGAFGQAILIGAGPDVVTVTAGQFVNTIGDGIKNSGTNVLVTSTTAVNPGSGKFGFNGAAGSMKVPASSNIGTTTGSVTTT